MKKRVFALCFLCASLLPIKAGAFDINGYGKVRASVLNVRKESNADSEILGTLKSGDSIMIITKTAKNWYKIDFNGEIGFVCADYVTAYRNDLQEIKKANEDVIHNDSLNTGQKAVEYAKEFLGVPYVWGGTDESGFDCSGLVYYVYSKLGIKLNRVAADQAKNGTEVEFSELAPGDLVFFWNKSRYSEINHVGIYVGDGLFIHAPQTGDVVKISSLESGYFAENLVAARRVAN